MAQDLAIPFYILFVAIGLVSAVLPLFLAWRAVAVSFLAWATGRLLEGPVHWSDQDLGYAMGVAIMGLVTVCVLGVIGLRMLIAGLRGTLTRDRLAGPDADWRDRLDAGILAIAGGVAGLLLAICLAMALPAAGGGGMALDIGLGLGAFAVAALAFRHRKAPSMSFVTAAGLAFAIVAFVGSAQSPRLRAAATGIAGDAPACFALPAEAGAPAPGRFGFFSLPKQTYVRHLELFLVTDEGYATHYWSIRNQRWIADGTREFVTCHPVAGGTEHFAPGDTFDVILAGQRLSIPREMNPRVYGQRLSFDSDATTGSDLPDPRFAGVIRVHAPDRPRGASDTVERLQNIPADGLDLEAMLQGPSRNFEGLDPETGWDMAFRCLSGAFSNRLCGAVLRDGDLAIEYDFPAADLPDWREAARTARALIASFEVP
ncbi:hypothetical protein HKCCE2091_00795 [Rhodobacterales bacterium HKCCE2091]|nr:hypothetical protein [Rhodobacterales bacterium HKCCE2091]